MMNSFVESFSSDFHIEQPAKLKQTISIKNSILEN